MPLNFPIAFIAWLFVVFADTAHATYLPQTHASDTLPLAREAIQEKRSALVIGNGSYAHARLPNARNDAKAVGNMLRSLGFDVTTLHDLDRASMKDALMQFGNRLDAGIGLVYFAGHGKHGESGPYLMPADTSPPPDIADTLSGIELSEVLAHMAPPRPGKRNLVILDMCLNDPADPALLQPGKAASPLAQAHAFPPSQSPPETLTQTQTQTQTIVVYATSPGAFAADGASHGLFTSHLLAAMQEADTDVDRLFQRVRMRVGEATRHAQLPHVVANMPDPFALRPPGMPASMQAGMVPAVAELPLVMQSRGVLPKDSAEQYELTFWESIKDSNHAADYEAYLQAYPSGRFAPLARARVQRLKAQAPAPAAPAAPPKVAAPAEKPAGAVQPPPPAAAERPARTPPAARTQAERPRAETARPAPDAAAPPPPKAAEAPIREQPLPPVTAGEIKDCPQCPVLVPVKAGAFTMGSAADDPSERPPRRVTVNEPFAIGKYEVTVEQWDACTQAGACPRIGADATRPRTSPVRDVSWDDAQLFVQWLSKTSGKSYRLPSEAEWEFALRGGTSSRYWWGEQMQAGKANCKDCGEPWQRDAPASVGSFAPNPFGLHDMNGSVWEWVSDCWHNSYKGAPADARSWDEPNCRVRVIRGGSWREGASYMPSSTRFKYDASVRHSQNGFRVARSLK